MTWKRPILMSTGSLGRPLGIIIALLNRMVHLSSHYPQQESQLLKSPERRHHRSNDGDTRQNNTANIHELYSVLRSPKSANQAGDIMQ